MTEETPRQRRRRLTAGWTEADHLRAEDEAFARSLSMLRWFDRFDLLRKRLTPNQIRAKPKGAPSGASIVDAEILDQAVDRMRRNRTKFNVVNLARESGYGRNTILRWSKKHPEPSGWGWCPGRYGPTTGAAVSGSLLAGSFQPPLPWTRPPVAPAGTKPLTTTPSPDERTRHANTDRVMRRRGMPRRIATSALALKRRRCRFVPPVDAAPARP
jgi:hypothetical protein